MSVLRSGGDYCPAHVLRLRDQVAAASPDVAFACLSDVAIEGVDCTWLAHDWPGWWAKMELFRPDIEGDFLYLDLDTSVVGPIDGFFDGGAAIMRDVYRPRGLQSSVMYLPEPVRAEVWRKWIAGPQEAMRAHRAGGDQAFLETIWLPAIDRLQDRVPGKIVSYKADVLKHGLSDAARLVVFHGTPRPWQVGW